MIRELRGCSGCLHHDSCGSYRDMILAVSVWDGAHTGTHPKGSPPIAQWLAEGCIKWEVCGKPLEAGTPCLAVGEDGLAHRTDTGQYTHAYPIEVREVRGWGPYVGMQQWYKLGMADGPETAWECCFGMRP